MWPYEFYKWSIARVAGNLSKMRRVNHKRTFFELHVGEENNGRSLFAGESILRDGRFEITPRTRPLGDSPRPYSIGQCAIFGQSIKGCGVSNPAVRYRRNCRTDRGAAVSWKRDEKRFGKFLGGFGKWWTRLRLMIERKGGMWGFMENVGGGHSEEKLFIKSRDEMNRLVAAGHLFLSTTTYPIVGPERR